MSNDSQDLGKGMKDSIAGAGKKAMKGKRMLNAAKKGVKVAAKLMKFFLKSIVSGAVKAIVTVLGPYALVVLLVIILLLLVVDSIRVFDIFQEGGEREAVEVLFDETVLEVIKDRQEEAPTTIKETLRSTQNEAPWPMISESWLQQTGEMMKISFAIPSMHHYYKNLKHDNYKAWHKDYKEKDISTPSGKEAVKNEFKKLISKEYDYYYQDVTYQPKFTWSTPPKKEYKKIKTKERCEREIENDDGTTTTVWGPETETIVDQNLKVRKIVTDMSLLYNEATVPYMDYESDWTTEVVTKSGNCEIKKSEKYYLYIINDGQPVSVTFNPNTLVSFMTVDAPEGKLSKLVRPEDLEYALELGKNVDPAFPTVNMKFDKFVKCTKKNSISSCIGEFVQGGSIGYGGTITGDWYPSEYLELYKKAADACGIDWWLLASIHGQETGFSSNPAATDPTKGSKNASGEYVGALGHFQFMPLTWVGWSYANSGAETTGKGNILGDISFIKNPAMIAKYGGLGKDANGDGEASPWDLEDAAYTAACYLKRSGYIKEDESAIKKAIRAYNHSESYVSSVYTRGMKFKESPSGEHAVIPVAQGSFTWPTTGAITSKFGYRGDIGIPGASKYHYGLDIGGGGRGTVPIVSAADGVVSRNKWIDGYGNVVFVKHNIEGKSFETVYAHMVSPGIVKTGSTVQKGQTIGYMGNTGTSGGKHLHFEIHSPNFVRMETNSMNPLNYIPVPPVK